MSINKWLVPLLCIFTTKVIIIGSLPETLALAIFAAFVIIQNHYDTHKEVKSYKDALEETKKEFALKFDSLTKEVDTTKTSIASFKIANSMRGFNGQQKG